MYTEIRELVNFLARFFHLRVPKLKIGTFCEHMANNCLFRFQPYWNINQPKQHEEQRIIRISRAVADEVITAAATAVGLLLDELLNCLPERMILYINPGELFYTTSDYSPPVSIWVGSVNEDLNYEKNTQSLIPPPPLPSTILPQMPASIQPLSSLFQRMSMMSGNASGIQIANGYHSLNSGLGAPKLGLSTAADSVSNMADFTMLEWRVNLALVHPRELGYELTNPFSGFLMFRYLIQGTPKFTVETFAATRFGSYRKRPDHEKKFVDAIKDFVNSDSSATNTESTTSTGGGTWSSSSEGGIWSTSPSPGFSVRRQQYGSGGIGGLEGYCPPMP